MEPANSTALGRASSRAQDEAEPSATASALTASFEEAVRSRTLATEVVEHDVLRLHSEAVKHAEAGGHH